MANGTTVNTLTDQQQELCRRLQMWCLDPPGTVLPFAAKLAQEQGWTLARSERVIQEYRRFLFLALEAGHPVSPSQAVDMAWHQHLLDTRQYWEEFCPQVLGRPLHHIPSRGGEEERQRMGKWYRDTLRSYHAFFGTPPAEIWPVCDGVACPSAGLRRKERARWWGLRWVLKLGSTAEPGLNPAEWWKFPGPQPRRSRG